MTHEQSTMNDRPTIAVVLYPEKIRGAHQRYTVKLKETGETILTNAKDPEWQAARELINRGYIGRYITQMSGSDAISFDLDLEAAAQFATAQPDRGLPKIKTWSPFTGFSEATE